MLLTEIASAWTDLEAQLEASGGEVTPEIEAALAGLLSVERDKVDAYASIIKSLEAKAEASAKLADEIAQKARSAARRAQWLKDRMASYLGERGLERVEGTVWRFQFERNGGKPPIELLVKPEELPAEYQKIAIDADREKLRKMLDTLPDGARLAHDGTPIARLGARGKSLRIR